MRLAIIVTELSDASPIIMHIFWFVWWWLWSKRTSTCIIGSIAAVWAEIHQRQLSVYMLTVSVSWCIPKYKPVWGQTYIIHQCVGIFQAFQTSCWMIIGILNDLHRFSTSLRPLNAKKFIYFNLIFHLLTTIGQY